jgi:hypothetical protein
MRFTRQLDDDMDSRKGQKVRLELQNDVHVGEAIGTRIKESCKDPTKLRNLAEIIEGGLEHLPY